MTFTIEFPKRHFQTPLLYRIAEGLTTFSMLIGFIIGGGSVGSILFWFYFLHAMASFYFHINPSSLTFLFDVSMIDLLVVERGYVGSHYLWIYPCYLVILFHEKKKTHWMLIVRMLFIVLLTANLTPYYVAMWLLSLLSFLQCSYFTMKKDIFKTTFTCCLFHLYVGCVSYLETKQYDFTYELNWIDKFVRYCSYLTFCFLVSNYLTNNPRQTNCVLTFIPSILLTPFSLYQTWFQCKHP